MATNPMLAQRQTPRREPLAGAYAWLLSFMVVYCARPQEWIPKIGAVVPLGKVTGILAFLALCFAIGRVRQRLPREVIYLTLLIAQLWLTVPMSTVWRGGALDNVLEFSKVLPIVIVISLAVRNETRLRRLLLLQSTSVAIIAAIAIWKGHFSAGRLGLEGVVGGNYANPNDLAFSIVLTLPLCLVFFFQTRNIFVKAFWLMAMPIMIYAALLTGSRGGVICFVVAAGVCLWEFAIKGRRRYLLIAVPLAAIVFWIFSGGEASRRFGSTFQNNDELAYSSTQERWSLLIKSLRVTAEHPLFGVGPGNFSVVSGYWRITHNSFTQMSSEGGLPAFLLFVLILRCAFQNVESTKRLTRAEGTSQLAGAFRASLVAYVVGSFFSAECYQLFTYFLVAYTTSLNQITVAQEESTGQPAEHASTVVIKKPIGKNSPEIQSDRLIAHGSSRLTGKNYPAERFG